jgi:hypothetical protein
MKKLLILLLCSTTVLAEEVNITSETAQLCGNLIAQVQLSAKDPNLVQAAQALAAAKADLDKKPTKPTVETPEK